MLKSYAINQVLAVVILGYSFNSFANRVANTVESEQTVNLAIKQEVKHHLVRCSAVNTWHHMNTSPSEYIDLKQPLTVYQLQRYKGDCATASESDNQASLSGVLVKKLVNWHQQHSNGFDINLSQHKLTFAMLEKITFQLFVEKEKTFLVKKEELIQHPWLEGYAPKPNNSTHQLLNKTAISNQLIDDLAHVKFVFYSTDHHNTALKTLYASYNLAVKTEQLAEQLNNQPQDVELTLAQFNYYFEQNYQPENTEYTAVKNLPIDGVLIMAESVNNKVLRNYFAADISDNLSNDFTELFNEIAIKISALSLTVN